RHTPTRTLFPYTTLFRSGGSIRISGAAQEIQVQRTPLRAMPIFAIVQQCHAEARLRKIDVTVRADLVARQLQLRIARGRPAQIRSEEHTSELQSREKLVC